MIAVKTVAAVLAAAGIASALPAASSTTPQAPSTTVALTGVTHSVTAGLAGLHFDPENVVAAVGDVVEWLYLPKNHSVAQSSFQLPCKPLNGDQGFFSGFQFPTKSGLNPQVFQIVIEDTLPIWYYCAQTDGNHCQNGMSGVINQNFDSPNTLAAYQAAAALTNISIVPPFIQGGSVLPNPNPGSGFN